MAAMTHRAPANRLPAGVWLSSSAVVALLLTVSARYGFHRDELYFVVAGRRLDWGYVDQPPLTPLVARVSEIVLGTSPTALRVLPALAVGGVGILAALMARRFGGGRLAQVFAALTASFTGVVLGEGHLLSTAIFDYLFWGLALWILVLILDGASPRWWLAMGFVVGIGLLNKHTIAFLAVGILLGVLVTRHRRLLLSPFPWIGVLIATVMALPNLLWQAANGWPQLEMAQALGARSDGPLAFVLFQPLLLSISLAVPAGAGLWWLARPGRGRDDDARRWRPFAIAYGILFVAFLGTGGKAYYISPFNTVLLAAGSIWFERLGTIGRRVMGASAGVGIAVGLFVALPVLPVESSGALDATGELGETVGWSELVDQIAVAYQSIPSERRSDTVVFTGSYGEAGAVAILGPEVGLPDPASGHNNYWIWGPPPPHGAIIGVGYVASYLEPICPDLDQVATLGNSYGVENEVVGQPLLICLDPTGQLADIWDSTRHYN